MCNSVEIGVLVARGVTLALWEVPYSAIQIHAETIFKDVEAVILAVDFTQRGTLTDAADVLYKAVRDLTGPMGLSLAPLLCTPSTLHV